MDPVPDRDSTEHNTFGELTNWFIQLKKMHEDNNKRSHAEANNTETNSSKKRRYVVLQHKKSDN